MYYHVQHVLVVASVLGENAIGKMHADVVVKWMTDDGKNQATRADGCTSTGPKSNFLSDQQNNRTSLRAPRRRAARQRARIVQAIATRKDTALNHY